MLGYGLSGGSGNKMNLRLEMLQNLLQSLGDGSSAKVNSLKQTIRRNKTDTADNTTASLELMRRVFQHEITDELRQILDRHVRTTFLPAFENLRRNGHPVCEENINHLCRSILEGAKASYMDSNTLETLETLDLPLSNPPRPCPPRVIEPRARLITESDAESDISSIVSQSSNRAHSHQSTGRNSAGRKRGRPKKLDVDSGRCGTPIMMSHGTVAGHEAAKWDPERILEETRFVLGSKANKIVGAEQRGRLFIKYPRLFRYVADEADKEWLLARNLTTRVTGKTFILVYEDVLELARLENCR